MHASYFEKSESAVPYSRALISAEGVSCGTFGELLQGVATDGTEFLATFPIEVYSHAIYTLNPEDRQLTIEPASKKKSLLLARNMLLRFGRAPVGHISIFGGLKEGKGLASSSADMVATARAIARATGIRLSCSELENLLREIEPTDGVMYPGCVHFAHREVALKDHIGFLPSIDIVGADQGGIVDTVNYNKGGRRFRKGEDVEYEILLERLKSAVRSADLSGIGHVATRSAEMNQHRHEKIYLHNFLKLAADVAALGVAASHSGTYLGILLAGDDVQINDKKSFICERIRSFGLQPDSFSSWRGMMPAPRHTLDWPSMDI